MDQMERSKNSAMPVLVDLVAMYVITGLLLVGLAALLGRMDLSDAAVSIGIIATYMMWGLCVGAFYFAVLLLGNLVVNRGLDGQLVQMLTTAVLCILSGMAGGMLS